MSHCGGHVVVTYTTTAHHTKLHTRNRQGEWITYSIWWLRLHYQVNKCQTQQTHTLFTCVRQMTEQNLQFKYDNWYMRCTAFNRHFRQSICYVSNDEHKIMESSQTQVAWWRNGYNVGLAINRSRDQILLGAMLRNNLGQVVHTYVPLSPSSITWYSPKGSDALRLGR